MIFLHLLHSFTVDQWDGSSPCRTILLTPRRRLAITRLVHRKLLVEKWGIACTGNYLTPICLGHIVLIVFYHMMICRMSRIFFLLTFTMTSMNALLYWHSKCNRSFASLLTELTSVVKTFSKIKTYQCQNLWDDCYLHLYEHLCIIYIWRWR